MKKIFSGSCVALITPFKKERIDYEKLEELLYFHKVAGTSAILILGTTGESPTVSYEERDEIIRFCRARIDGETKLLVGAGTNCTKTSIMIAQKAERLGADGLLVVSPYYNKCTQDGLFNHYKKIAESVRIPIILYNVPSRTSVNIEPETALRLSNIENICGIKEANPDFNHIQKMIHSLHGKMAVYSGNDDLNHYFLENGANGVISVTANVFPELVAEHCKLMERGEVEEAKIIHEKLSGINKALFVETNPIPVKYAASLLKLCDNELRLPLTPLSFKNITYVKKEIEKLKNF